MGNLVIEDNELKIKYPIETNDIIDEEFIRDENVAFGEQVGPINSLILSRAEDGDTIYRKDNEDIGANGLHELKIKDNILLSSSQREDFIDEMFNFIKGFKYKVVDFVSTGVAYYDFLDRFTVSINGVNYSTILLNSELIIEDGLKENIFAPKLEESTTDYSTSAVTDKGMKNATIIANKSQAKIELITYEQSEIGQKIAEQQISIGEITERVSSISDFTKIKGWNKRSRIDRRHTNKYTKTRSNSKQCNI